MSVKQQIDRCTAEIKNSTISAWFASVWRILLAYGYRSTRLFSIYFSSVSELMGSNIRQLSDFSRPERGGASETFWTRERSTEYLTGGRPTELRCIDMFLPGFTWNSCVLWISFVQIIFYVITVFVGSSQLEPSGSVLSMFGSSYGPPIQSGQVWRLLTPLFLHGSIWYAKSSDRFLMVFTCIHWTDIYLFALLIL